MSSSEISGIPHVTAGHYGGVASAAGTVALNFPLYQRRRVSFPWPSLSPSLVSLHLMQRTSSPAYEDSAAGTILPYFMDD